MEDAHKTSEEPAGNGGLLHTRRPVVNEPVERLMDQLADWIANVAASTINAKKESGNGSEQDSI